MTGQLPSNESKQSDYRHSCTHWHVRAEIPIYTVIIQITCSYVAPVHVELAPSRRETVSVSCGRSTSAANGSEVRPGHGGGVERVQVVKQASLHWVRSQEELALVVMGKEYGRGRRGLFEPECAGTRSWGEPSAHGWNCLSILSRWCISITEKRVHCTLLVCPWRVHA